MSMVDKERVKDLLKRAPETLVREGDLAIMQPDTWTELSGLDYYGGLGEDKLALAETVGKRAINNEVRVWSVGAKQLLKDALETPKYAGSTDEGWFLAAVDGLGELIEEQRFGRAPMKVYDQPFSEPALFHDAMREWKRKVHSAADHATLYEYGIIAEGADGQMGVASVGVPWDKSWRSWQSRLTPESIFVGRQAELDAFSKIMTGKSLAEARVEQAFNADDLQMWWGEAMDSNVILRGRYNDTQILIRPEFRQRVNDKLRRQLLNRNDHNLIVGAEVITGYLVEARAGTFPGSISLEMRLDKSNWVESSKRKISHTPTKWTDRKVWSEGGGHICLHDSFEELTRDRGLSFYVMLDTDEQDTKVRRERTQVRELQITRHLRNKQGLDKPKHYWVNNPTYGDGYSWQTFGREVKPLDIKDWLELARLYKMALKQGVTDSESKRQDRPGLSTQTTQTLGNVRRLLESKMQAAGISNEVINKAFEED